ncbi:MAG: alpha/beta hydrolase family protein [Gemmatimonadales bacterium]
MSPPEVILLRPPEARALLVLAHGAGAGMRHPFMQAIAESLAGERVATFRYQFPYMDAGAHRPDPPAVAEAAVRAAVDAARAAAPDLPLFAGGKSFGGRMTSTAGAHAPLDGVRGLVFLGFPLHPAGRPGVTRAAHLERVTVPMLFLQGTRDSLAVLDLMGPVCDHLGARATLHVVDGADHSFSMLKRSGRSNAEVLTELAATISAWTARIADSG